MSNPAKGGGQEAPAPSHPEAELRIGMAVYDSVHPETMGSVYAIGKYGLLDMAVGTYIERARNEIAKRAIEGGNDYLLFVDSDMVFEVEDLFALKEALDNDPKMGAVAALYVYRDSTLKPVAHWIKDGMWQSGIYVLNRTLKNMEEGVVDDVDVFGTGFMLIRVEALRSLSDPYFKTEYDDKTMSFWGEDAMLAKRLKENGWRSCVHFGVQVGHIGRAAFYPKELLNIDIPEAEEAIEAAGMMEQKMLFDSGTTSLLSHTRQLAQDPDSAPSQLWAEQIVKDFINESYLELYDVARQFGAGQGCKRCYSDAVVDQVFYELPDTFMKMLIVEVESSGVDLTSSSADPSVLKPLSGDVALQGYETGIYAETEYYFLHNQHLGIVAPPSVAGSNTIRVTYEGEGV